VHRTTGTEQKRKGYEKKELKGRPGGEKGKKKSKGKKKGLEREAWVEEKKAQRGGKHVKKGRKGTRGPARKELITCQVPSAAEERLENCPSTVT